MQQLILVFHILIAITLIALVLLQHGKGADIGAAFGSGASSTMFGSIGSTPFLIKLTAILAFLFFFTCIMLTYLTSAQFRSYQTEEMPVPETQSSGVTPPTSTPTPTPTQESTVVPATKPTTVPVAPSVVPTKKTSESKAAKPTQSQHSMEKQNNNHLHKDASSPTSSSH